MANLPRLRGRRPTTADAPTVHHLLRHGEYNHLHVDWRMPVEWLEEPGAVLMETTADDPAGPGHVRACLVVGADPPPAAWVRIFAVQRMNSAPSLLEAMLEWLTPDLRRRRVDHIGWLPREDLPARWMEATGFRRLTAVETYVREGVSLPGHVRVNDAVEIRPVRAEDFPTLAAIEAEAFAPLWRHSVGSLRRGWHHARSFHVAVLDGAVVGFQYSADSDRPFAAHLVRLTVSPRVQRTGIGSTLMLAALDSYRRQGIKRVSLNTQVDNIASRYLYRKFDFKSVGQHLPVWCLELQPTVADAVAPLARPTDDRRTVPGARCSRPVIITRDTDRKTSPRGGRTMAEQYHKLSEQEIEEALAELPGWSVQNGKFHKTFQFDDFSQAVGWMMRVALEAEKLDHHPDWCNSWNKVQVNLMTHAVGALSEHDVNLAQKMEELAS